jgi:hypothetical protein
MLVILLVVCLSKNVVEKGSGWKSWGDNIKQIAAICLIPCVSCRNLKYLLLVAIYARIPAHYELSLIHYGKSITHSVSSITHYESSVANFELSVDKYGALVLNLRSEVGYLQINVSYLCCIIMELRLKVADQQIIIKDW